MDFIEYVITLKQDASKSDILDALSRSTSGDESINSDEIPDRAIPITTFQSKPGSQRVFRVNMTLEESVILNNNPSVISVEGPRAAWNDDWLDNQNLIVGRYPYWGGTANTKLDNWGLMYHSNQTNDFTYTNSRQERYNTWSNTTFAGRGVDLIIQEGGMFHFALKEFQDPINNEPRFHQFDWRTLNNCSHTANVDYTAMAASYSVPSTWANASFNYHATLGASIAGGKRYGWAKFANLYSVPLGSGLWGAGIGYDDAFDVIKEFHLMKVRDVESWGSGSKWAHTYNGYATVRPTVVNASFGQKISLLSITSLNFRGNNFIEVLDLDGPPKAPVPKFGVIGTGGSTYNYVNYASPSIRAECQEMTDAGVIYVKSAGNQRQKIDVPGGVDYDNYVTLTTPDSDGYTSGDIAFYNRGAGNISNTTIVVGSTGNYPVAPAGLNKAASGQLTDGRNETISYFSERGPRVDIYAAGEYVYGIDNYPADGVQRNSGTSFSSPQVAGMVATIAGKYPNTTPTQMRTAIRCNSFFHQSLTLFDWTPSAQTSHSWADLALGDPVYFADTRVNSPIDRNLLGSKGSDGPADMGSPYAYAGNGYSITGNVAYLGQSPWNPAETFAGTTLPDLGYDAHTEPTLNTNILTTLPDGKLVQIDYTKLNYYPRTANACLSRFGTTNNYRYYKFVAYDDFARTVPSQRGCIAKIGMVDQGGNSLLGTPYSIARFVPADPTLVPATGMYKTTHDVWDGFAGVYHTVTIASDFKRTITASGVMPYSGASAFDGSTSYVYETRTGIGAELHIDFGREVYAKEIYTTYHDLILRSHEIAKFWDIYGSHTPFTETIGITNEGVKIGEFNKADIWLDPIYPLHGEFNGGLLQGINPLESETVPPGETDDAGMWNPLVSPSGWYRVPTNSQILAQLGDTTQFVANASIV